MKIIFKARLMALPGLLLLALTGNAQDLAKKNRYHGRKKRNPFRYQSSAAQQL